jgi:hypothetical protein
MKNLQSLCRGVKTYATLPSRGIFYDADTIELVDTSDEVGIRSMTGPDELMFKNPDALLNGEAMRNALISCVVGLKNPDNLLVNDVDALMVAIRIATYGDEMDLAMDCPKCGNQNTFALDLPTVQATMGVVDDSYEVDLSSGTVVSIRPYLYKDHLKLTLATFQQMKLIKSMEDPALSEEQKLKIFDKSFKELVKANIDMLSNAITKVTNEEHDLEVVHNKETHQDVVSFISNIDKADSELISNKVKEVNEVGILREINVCCDFCKHEWVSPISFDPVVFLSGS